MRSHFSATARTVEYSSRFWNSQAIVLGGLWLLSSASLHAIEPNVFEVGNFDITPTLNSEVSFDDNVFRQETDELESTVGIITPRVLAAYTDEVNVYELDFEATKGLYSATSEDDYTAWRFGANAHLELTSRHLFDISYEFDDSVQARGTGYSQFGDLPDDPDELERQDASLSYQFGADDSLARVVLEVNHADVDFTNNEEFLSGRDYDRDGWRGTFFYNVLPRTDILLETRGAKISYDEADSVGTRDFSDLGSDEVYGYVGVRWEATARTTGNIRFGYGEKNFDSARREDISEPSYEIGLEYAPLTYSVFELSAIQDFAEGIGIGDAIERQLVSLNWRHDWSDGLTSELSLGHEDDDYTGSTLTDTFKRYSASVNYEFARWLDLSVGILMEDRDSNRDTFSYDRTLLTLGFEASF